MKRLSSLVLQAALAALASGAVHAAPVPLSDPLGLAGGRTELRLGTADLPQQVELEHLEPGVSYYAVRRGKAAQPDSWYLLGDVARDVAAQAKLKDCFAQLGLRASASTFRIAGAGQPTYTIVTGGRYASRTQAEQAAQSRPGCPLHARRSAEDVGNGSGPWRVHILAIAPDKAAGRWLAMARQDGPVLRERTSQLARSADALFAVNGGFFVEKAVDGVPGEPAGISVLAGRVNGAPVSHRPALVVQGGGARPLDIVRGFSWQAWLAWSDGSRTVLDGINRKPGQVRNCGRTENDRPVHDFTCTYQDDLVYYPAGSAFARALASEMQYAIAADGHVRKLAAGELPAATDALLAASPGTGRSEQIEQAIARGASASLQVDSSLPTAGKDASVINAGPTLLQHGDYVREDAQEGWAIDAVDDPAHALLMHDWINRRNPRTAVGIRKDGTIVVVVVDGHRPGTSVGVTIEELRDLMASLGAADAVNLDGGGSSAMAVRGRLVNSPSDLEGERRIGDALLFTTHR